PAVVGVQWRLCRPLPHPLWAADLADPARRLHRHPAVDAQHEHRQASRTLSRDRRESPMTILQLGLLGGGLIGLAAALLLWRLAPARPDLADTFDRLSPRPVVTQQTTVAAVDNTQRLGQ